mgnify:CR=1 FL=1
MAKKDLLIVGSGLTARQLKIFYTATPEDKIKTRPAKGGDTWKYVSGSYVKQVLNALFGVEWTFEIETSVKDAFEVAKVTGQCVVKGTLTVPIGDKLVRRSQFGRCDVKFKTEWDDTAKKKIVVINEMTGQAEPLDFGNDLKGAGTDALKKCANEIGLFMDIYSNDDFIEVQVADVGATEDQKDAIVNHHVSNNS